MTNQEAIGLLKIERVRITPTVFTEIVEAIDMAIKALEAQELSNNSPKLDKENGDLQPTCNKLATDAISRQAAIDVLEKIPVREFKKTDGLLDALVSIGQVYRALKQLPSVPKPEIVRCRDCKHFRTYYHGTGSDPVITHACVWFLDRAMGLEDYCSKGVFR